MPTRRSIHRLIGVHVTRSHSRGVHASNGPEKQQTVKNRRTEYSIEKMAHRSDSRQKGILAEELSRKSRRDAGQEIQIRFHLESPKSSRLPAVNCKIHRWCIESQNRVLRLLPENTGNRQKLRKKPGLGSEAELFVARFRSMACLRRHDQVINPGIRIAIRLLFSPTSSPTKLHSLPSCLNLRRSPWSPDGTCWRYVSSHRDSCPQLHNHSMMSGMSAPAG